MKRKPVKDYPLDLRAGFFAIFAVSGSPIAASTTDRASFMGSDGFLAGNFFFLAFGFGMSSSCQSRRPFASPSEIQTLPVPSAQVA